MIPISRVFGIHSFLLLGFLLLFLPLVISQSIDLTLHPEYQSTSYQLGKEHGLRGNLITNFLQDRTGYVWVVSNSWVQRYNGTYFETFFRVPDLQGYSVILLEDEMGKIWVCKVNRKLQPIVHLDVAGIWLLDPQNKQTISWADFTTDIGLDLPLTSISGIGYSECSGAVLIGRSDGAVLASNLAMKVLTTFPKGTPVFQIAEGPDGTICLTSGQDLVLQDKHGRQLAQYTMADIVTRVELDRQLGVLFRLIGYRQTYQYIPFGGVPQDTYTPFALDLRKVDHYDAPPQVVSDSFLVTRREIFKVGTAEPLLQCGTCPQYYMDRQHNIWTSNMEGITVLRLHPKRFTTLLTDKGVETRGLLQVNDSLLLVHAFKGSFVVDLHDSIHAFNPSMAAFIGMAKDPEGGILEGVYGVELAYLAPGKWEHLDARRTRDSLLVISDNFTLIPFFSSDGGCWLGQKEGLRYCFRRPGSDFPERCFAVEDSFLQKATVNYLEEIDGRLWAATSEGLFEIDLQTHEVIRRHALFSGININHFAIDGETIWLSTFYHGLLRWQYGSATYQAVPLAELGPFMEIPSLCAVYDDGLGYLWLPSNLGLYRLHKASCTYQRYDRNHHISHDEFNYFSHTRLRDGRLAFGSLNGITIVNPALTRQLERVEPSFILDLTNGLICHFHVDREVPIRNEEQINLLGHKENLQFDCNLLDYRSGVKGKIMYMVEGIDLDWRPLQGKTLRLERLPFGRFNLRIKAISFDDLHNSNEWNIPLYSLKPWHLSTWAIALYSLLVFGGGAGVVTYRYRSMRRAKMRLEELVQKRTMEIESSRNYILSQNEELSALNDYKNKIMAIIGHDMRGPILGLRKMGQKVLYMLERGESERVLTLFQESEKQIDHLRMLIDNVLAWSLVQSKGSLAFNRSQVSLQEVTQDQIKLLETEILEKKQQVQFSSEVEQPLNAQDFLLTVLIRNLLVNSIRYSGEGSEIRIRLLSHKGVPCFTIADEGPGMPPALMEALNRCEVMETPFSPGGEEGLGLGLWICTSLIQHMHARWHFQRGENGRGLEVKLCFPNQGSPHERSTSQQIEEIAKIVEDE